MEEEDAYPGIRDNSLTTNLVLIAKNSEIKI